MSRKRVEHPQEVVKPGQKVKVKVTRIEKKGERISLSLKELEPDPWQGIEERFQRASSFTGTIARRTEFGLFVEIEPGVEGLVHVSQLAIGADLNNAKFDPGNEITGWIREVDAGRRRLSLTQRTVPETDPWKGVKERYEEGAVVTGQIEQATRFGFFVELEPGLTGLLPFAVVTAPAGRRKEHAYRPGQDVRVQVMQVDAKRHRISLGLEGSAAEGSKADYKNYVKQQRDDSASLGTLAAAFEKLKGQGS
jgi:small subunit ribosomal protein S1